jgi:hypothetical protein
VRLIIRLLIERLLQELWGTKHHAKKQWSGKNDQVAIAQVNTSSLNVALRNSSPALRESGLRTNVSAE